MAPTRSPVSPAARRRCALLAALLLITPLSAGSLGAAEVAPLAPVTATDARWGINHIMGQARLQRMAREAGASWNRWEFRWADIETQRGRPQFGTHDAMVNASMANGFEIQGILISTPDWARDPRTGLPSGLNLTWDDPGNHWGRFVRQIATRYRGKVHYWEVWNEPDDREVFWSGTVADYYQLLKVAYLSVKSVDPSARVLMGGLAYWPNPGFLPELLNLMVADPIGRANNYFFDVLVWHTYSRPSDSYDRVVQSRALLAATVGPRPIWINEMNVPAWDESPVQNYRPYAWAATAAEQAAYLIQAFAFGLAAGVDRMSVYRLQDTESPEAYGLLRGDGTVRPAYVAYQVASKYFSGVSSAALLRRDELEQVVMRRAGERVTVVWNRTPRHLSLALGAAAPAGTLVDQRGGASPLRTQAGQYRLALGPATANHGAHAADYFIGGPPLILVEPIPAGLQSVEEESPLIAYGGDWELIQNPSASAAAVRRTRTTGQAVALEFADPSITWVTSRGPDRGIARVEVDGVLQAEIDLYSPLEVWNDVYTFGEFGPGGHRVTITATGRRAPAALGAFVDIDSLAGVALKSTTPPAPPAPAVTQPVTAAPAGARGQGGAYAAAAPVGASRVALPLVTRSREGWTTTIALQNTGESPAHARVRFYDDAGVEMASQAVGLEVHGSARVDPRTVPGLGDGFRGAAVVESVVPIVASVTQAREGADALSYAAPTTPGERLAVPLWFHDYHGWDSSLHVQNLDDAAAPVTITYQRTDGPGGPWRETGVVPPRAARTFGPGAAGPGAAAEVPAGFVGSAVVQGPPGARLSAVVTQVHQSGSVAGYEAAATGASVLSAPLLSKNAGGWSTGLQVQNVGASTSTVTVTYRASDGRGPWTESATIPAGASATFYQPANAQLPDGFVGAAVVTSTGGQPLVGLVNEVHAGRGVAMAYRALGEGAPALGLPHVARWVEGWSSGVQAQNLGADTTTVVLLLQDDAGVLVARALASVAPGAAHTFYLPALDGVPDGWRGSATLISAGGQPLGAVVNESRP